MLLILTASSLTLVVMSAAVNKKHLWPLMLKSFALDFGFLADATLTSVELSCLSVVLCVDLGSAFALLN